MMKSHLRVLCIEDNAVDAELLEAHLSMQEFDVNLKRVETSDELSVALKEDWDIALADYSLPQLNAVITLDLIRNSGRDLPVIVVSGTLGESRAIEMMKAGARDFIVKGDFLRLIPAIKRELAEAANRKARWQAEASLVQSKESFKRLADAMPQLVWTAAPDGSVTFANQRCFDYTGLAEENFLGWGWAAYVQPAEAIAQYKKFISEGKDVSIEHRLQCADGTSRWHLTRATPSFDRSGRISAWYAAATDIHEQKMVAEELRIAKGMAEQANEAKSAFLANMSHEIRTPLAAILGFAELLEDPSQSEADKREWIATIRRNGDLLSKVINQVLDLSKIESSKLEIESMPFEFKKVFEDVRDLLDLSAREKGLNLIFHHDANIPRMVISDPTRLKQVLINLVGNAVKFTSKGQVKVSSRLVKRNFTDSTANLEIEVTDSGIGISKEQAGKLFQPFVQADNSLTRKFGGTGLGLNLSRKLARALGGDVILAQSDLGQGSTFVFSFKVQLKPIAG